MRTHCLRSVMGVGKRPKEGRRIKQVDPERLPAGQARKALWTGTTLRNSKHIVSIAKPAASAAAADDDDDDDDDADTRCLFFSWKSNSPSTMSWAILDLPYPSSLCFGVHIVFSVTLVTVHYFSHSRKLPNRTVDVDPWNKLLK